MAEMMMKAAESEIYHYVLLIEDVGRSKTTNVVFYYCWKRRLSLEILLFLYSLGSKGTIFHKPGVNGIFFCCLYSGHGTLSFSSHSGVSN